MKYVLSILLMCILNTTLNTSGNDFSQINYYYSKYSYHELLQIQHPRGTLKTRAMYKKVAYYFNFWFCRLHI